jgi:hypothetical protein
MTSSFATYASQFLNRQRSVSGTTSSEQPLFFSFSTDDGSQHGSGHLHRQDHSDLDDGGDPHLRSSENTAGLTSMMNTRRELPDDGDDPYLRLDDVDPGSQYPAFSARLESSSHALSEQSRGWLAHQPAQLGPSSPSSSELDDSPPIPPPPKVRAAFTPSPPPPPPPLSLSLTQSLLPRDGHTRPIDLFSLPDPRYISRSRRKFHDSIWTSIWLAGLSICVLSSFLSLFLIRKPSDTPRSFPLPYTTFLHTIPLLVILTFTSAAVSYAHILLLRVFVKPVLIGTSVFIPATLLISSIWSFAGSFMWESDTVPTWSETWGCGLAVFSISCQTTNSPMLQLTSLRTYSACTCIYHWSAPLNITAEGPFNVFGSNSHHPIAHLPTPSTHLIARCLACRTPRVHPFLHPYLSFASRRLLHSSQFQS